MCTNVINCQGIGPRFDAQCCSNVSSTIHIHRVKALKYLESIAVNFKIQVADVAYSKYLFHEAKRSSFNTILGESWNNFLCEAITMLSCV